MVTAFEVYTLTCLPTGKVYVGITSNGIRKRWNSHKAVARGGSKTKLSRSIRKYGEAVFTIEHIASCRSFDDLLIAEKAIIAQLDSKKNGLNSTFGGDGVLGYEHAPETRAQWSLERKILWENKEYRERTSRSIKKGWHSRSVEEIERHRARARQTLSLHRPVRIKKEKPQKPYLGKGWNMSSRTHCARGHEFNPENTRISKRGGRICLTCKRAGRNVARDRRRMQERSAKQSEMVAA